MKPYKKIRLANYYLRRYPDIIRHIDKKNKDSKEIPLKIPNISGTAGESLIYHLIIDGFISVFDVTNITKIQLQGNRKTGLNKDGQIGGDIVIYHNNDKVSICEVKSFTHESGFTNKSINNDRADYWILCNLSSFRKGGKIIDISIIKNFYKYTNGNVIYTEGNKEEKLKLSNIIKQAREMGGDYSKAKSIDLESYFSGKYGKNASQNQFMKWD